MAYTSKKKDSAVLSFLETYYSSDTLIRYRHAVLMIGYDLVVPAVSGGSDLLFRLTNGSSVSRMVCSDFVALFQFNYRVINITTFVLLKKNILFDTA